MSKKYLQFYLALLGFDSSRRIGLEPDVDPNSEFVDSDYFVTDERLASRFVVVVAVVVVVVRTDF
jgi:hypothetical protein